MKTEAQTFEANPRKCVVQRVVEWLSIRTNAPSEGGYGGEPELTPSDIAAATAGVRDPIAQEIVGVLLADERSIRDMAQNLDEYGWFQWRMERRQGWIDLKTHNRLAYAAVTEYRTNKTLSAEDLCKFLGIGNAKRRHLLEHYKTLMSRVREAHQLLDDHLRNQIMRDAA